MAKFAVVLFQSGGCDYTIGCGTVFQILPESVQTMEEAEEYVMTEDKRGGLPYYGEQVNSATIFEIGKSKKVDVNAYKRGLREESEMLQKEERRKKFEQLKKEFG